MYDVINKKCEHSLGSALFYYFSDFTVYQKMKNLIKVGTFAPRTSDGAFLLSVSIYVLEEDIQKLLESQSDDNVRSFIQEILENQFHIEDKSL